VKLWGEPLAFSCEGFGGSLKLSLFISGKGVIVWSFVLIAVVSCCIPKAAYYVLAAAIRHVNVVPAVINERSG